MINEKFDPSTKPARLTSNTAASFPPIDTILLQPPKLLRIKSVLERTKLSRSYIYQLSKEGLFPRSLSLVQGGTSVAWVEGEIQEWIDSRIAERDGGAANE